MSGRHVLVPGAAVPLYVQLKTLIRDKIAHNEWKPHEALPGERQLMETYGLSRTTVRQALNELVSEGALYRRHGKGTFVAPRRLEQSLGTLMGFAEELRERGLSPQVHVLSAGMRRAPVDAAQALGLPEGSEVATIQRVVSVDLYPLFVDRTYITEPVGRMILGLDLASESIYRLIERLGFPIREGLQTIAAEPLSTADAKLLQVEPKAPALRIRRITYIDSEKPIEYSIAHYRGDQYQYRTKLVRAYAETMNPPR